MMEAAYPVLGPSGWVASVPQLLDRLVATFFINDATGQTLSKTTAYGRIMRGEFKPSEYKSRFVAELTEHLTPYFSQVDIQVDTIEIDPNNYNVHFGVRVQSQRGEADLNYAIHQLNRTVTMEAIQSDGSLVTRTFNVINDFTQEYRETPQ